LGDLVDEHAVAAESPRRWGVDGEDIECRFALSEGKERHWSSGDRQSLEIRVGSDPINRLTHR
jgi:hypothetical protein